MTIWPQSRSSLCFDRPLDEDRLAAGPAPALERVPVFAERLPDWQEQQRPLLLAGPDRRLGVLSLPVQP
ncbi:hypothetical protein ACIG5E_22795 [Kitasatospora sp. NPDC053057]|uniref:hypothetical protein n=1 Tax=Kitasatospora sp. NPDC053057 TaxID=3364062 RepID=UPI0037CBA8CD